jgi:hypothetical protein
MDVSAPRIALVLVVAAAAFGVAFVAAGSGSSDEAAMPAAESVEPSSDAPQVPSFDAPASVPALEEPPAPTAAPTPAPTTEPAPSAPAPVAPAPAPPSGGGGGGGGGGGPILEG